MARLAVPGWRRLLSDPRFLLTGIVAIGLTLRLVYLLHVYPFVDEYYSMLAVKMILTKGLPVMPSGLFYTHGLPYSYLGALFTGLFGFSQAMARLPSLLVSVATIPLLYQVGRRWFSPRAGLLAALMLALSPEAIEWGGRARMYALWQFCTLAAVYLLYQGLLRNGPTGTRVGGLLALAGAFLCHLRALLIVPPLVGGLTVAYIAGRRREELQLWRPRRFPWAELLALIAALASPLLFWAFDRPGAIASPDQINLKHWLNPIRAFVDILIGAQQFVIMPYLILTVFALAGILALCFRSTKRQLGPHDPSLIFLYIVGLGTMVEFSLVSPPIVRVPRYVFDILPLYFLIVARELDFMTARIQGPARGKLQVAVGLLPFLFIAVLFARPALATTATQHFGSQLALQYVGDHWQEGDRIATHLTATAYLEAGRCDYFVALENPFVWQTPNGTIDPHLGLPWIGTEAGLREIVAENSRLWLLVEKRYAKRFEEALGAQAQLVFDGWDVNLYLAQRGER